jgi:ribonuclease BN (tRNA processing enzyme)
VCSSDLLARKAGVKAVVLTHLVPGRDDDAAPDRYGDGVRAVFKGPVTVAKDLDRF